MADNDKTLYEVLGIPRNAKVTDIGRAYNRVRADMQKEDAAPNPRLAAMAKVAYETLSDPQRREEYDASLSRSAPRAGPSRRMPMAVALVAVLVAAGGGYYFVVARTPDRSGEKKLVAPQQLLETVSSRVGRVESALMSGEVHDLGTAVSVGENEMITTCHGITVGAQLSVKTGGISSKAELGRASQDLDICALTVKGSGAGIQVRAGLPVAHEKVEAVVLGATGLAQVREGSVTRLIDDPKGPVIDLKFAAPLENGTPIFDSQGRLAGIVTAPHSFGEGLVVALSGPRITRAREAVAAPTAAAAEPRAPQ